MTRPGRGGEGAGARGEEVGGLGRLDWGPMIEGCHSAWRYLGERTCGR